MVNNIDSFLELDLVFKVSNSIYEKQIFDPNINNVIFKNNFWEKVFVSWINEVITEPRYSISSNFTAKKSFSLGFEIIDDIQITTLNENWLHKTGPTDVLSFPIISESDFKNDISFIELGDIFISFEMAVKQSKEFNNTVQKELIWLASHGFLHLLGWDHQDHHKLEHMLQLQEYLISKLNLE